MPSVFELVQKHSQQSAPTNDWIADIRQDAAAWIPSEPLSLRVLQVRADMPRCVLEGGKAIPQSVLSCANAAWSHIDGPSSADRALNLLRAAAIEYTRGRLCSLLWLAGHCAMGIVRNPEAIQPWISGECALDWHSADAIIRAPDLARWLGQSPSDDLSDWISHYSHERRSCMFQLRAPANTISPVPSDYELLFAAAIIWIDEALSAGRSRKSLELLGTAAEAMRDGGFFEGWLSHEETMKKGAAAAGSKGGAARHRRTTSLKAWALKQAANSKGSDMEIARRLARQIPKELEEATVDPVRLIYNCLRGARRQSRRAP